MCHSVCIVKYLSLYQYVCVSIDQFLSLWNLSIPPVYFLQMNANDPSILSGYLQKSMDRGKTWNKRWFVITKEFAMYEFKAHHDIYAIATLPLPGYQVIFPVDNIENVFCLSHQQKLPPTYLQSECTASRDRWLNVLKKMVNLELPEESNRNSTHSSESSGSQNAEDGCDKMS